MIGRRIKDLEIVQRFCVFLEDFFPENRLQLLFPLSSFLLFVGSSYPWLPPRHTLLNSQFQTENSELWLDVTSRQAVVIYSFLLLIVRIAFLASIALWLLPLKNLTQKLKLWVITPVVAAVSIYSIFVAIAKPQRGSIFESKIQLTLDFLQHLPKRLVSLGLGFYVTLTALAVPIVAFQIFRRGRIALPVRFRSAAVGDVNTRLTLRTSWKVIQFLVVSNLLISTFSCFSILWVDMIPRTSTFGSRDFRGFEWGLQTIYALVTTVCAVAFLGKNRGQELKTNLLSWKIADASLALSIALSIVFLPRLLQGMVQQYDWQSLGLNVGVPFSLAELLMPRPFRLLLLVFITALFQEISLRGFLQLRLTEAVGLKRSIFLTGLVWALVPLGYGTRNIEGAFTGVPGVRTLAYFGVCIAFSVPLGWIFARTKSVIPPTLMHGAFMVFHEGSNIGIYLNDPQIYWLELLALAICGWYLFKRYPPAQPAQPPVQHLVPSESV